MHKIASTVVLEIASLRECYAIVMRLRLGDESFEILLGPINFVV